MVDEHKLLRDAGRMAEAQALLENAMFNEAHRELEASLVKAWIDSDPRDSDGRERLWAAVQANRKHKDYIAARVHTDGKLAAAQLKELSEAPRRMFGR